MDFHSLTRRDLQFLCKRNKIPANKTNLAMAESLNALEIVEGLDEYLNQSNSNVLQSPTSVAKLPPNTATRTTRRKTAVKAEPQPSSSLLVNRSCRVTSNKSLDGEMDQENVAQEPKNNNVKFEANVAKTPAARSTRKAPGAGSCSSKVQESKKGELVQSAYSTRRSTRLLEKGMADLSLKTKENLDKPEKIEENELKVSAQEKKTAGSEERTENTQVVPGRDLSASMEKEWEILKHDNDQVTGDLGDIAVTDANTETNKEEGNEVVSDEKESKNSLVQVNKQEETLQADKAVSEEGSKKNGTDQEIGDTEIYVGPGDIPVLEHPKTETVYDNEESKSVQAFNSIVQVEHQVTEEAIQKNDSEADRTNIFDEEAVVDRTDGVSEAEPEEDNSGVDSDGTISEADSNQSGNQMTEHAIQENDSKTEKTNTYHEEAVVEQTDSDLESELEEDCSGVDSDGTISEADSSQETEQAIQENDSETVKINTFDEDTMVNQTYIPIDIPVLEHVNSEIISDNKVSKNAQAFDSVVQVEHQEAEELIQENDSEPEKANTFDEEAVVDQTNGDSETELEEDDSSFDSDGTISEADSNQADNQETEQAIQENDSETEKTNTFHEEAVVDLSDGDSEAELEEDSSGVDSDGTIFETDSNQSDNQETDQENDYEKINTSNEEEVLDQTDGGSEAESEEDSSGVDSGDTISEADSNREIEHAIQENDPETEKINTFNEEDKMVDQTDGNLEGDQSGVDSDFTISEADSNQAVHGSDIAEVEMILSETEGSVTAPTSPRLPLEEAVVNTAPLSPFVADSISAQFPRPNKSASKNSTTKVDNVGTTNKENKMEMMMMMNVVSNGDNGESKGEAKKKKKVEIDEENLKDASMRQLVKMVKELSIKSSNSRAALQILPGNNQIAE